MKTKITMKEELKGYGFIQVPDAELDVVSRRLHRLVILDTHDHRRMYFDTWREAYEVIKKFYLPTEPKV